jgi:hypothetical protein
VTLKELQHRRSVYADYKRVGDALRAIPPGTKCGCGACDMTPTAEALAEVQKREDEIAAWLKEAEDEYARDEYARGDLT